MNPVRDRGLCALHDKMMKHTVLLDNFKIEADTTATYL